MRTDSSSYKTTRWILWLILAAMIIFTAGTLLVYLSPVYRNREQSEKITGVVRLFMHEPKHFSVMVKDPETGGFVIRDFGQFHPDRPITFIADVPADEMMWVVIGSHRPGSVTFHIHSEKSVEGAGWDHGKLGKGQTHVVE